MWRPAFSRTLLSAIVSLGAGGPVHRSLGEGGRPSAEARAVTADSEEPSQSELKWLAQLHTIGHTPLLI